MLGPIQQGQFLREMGIEARLLMLLDRLQTNEQRKELMQSFQRLISPSEMGKVYQVCAITQEEISVYPFSSTK